MYVCQLIIGDRILQEWHRESQSLAIAETKKEFDCLTCEATDARVITLDGELVWSIDTLPEATP